MRSIKHTCAAVAASLVLSLSPLSAAFAADNVTMNIKDGDIRDVLTALSYLGEQSIVTDDSVKGKISIAFNDIPFETALDLVTRTKGLAYRTVHGVIVVSANEEMSKNFGDVTIYKLNYAKAEDVKTMMQDLLKDASSAVGVDPVTNSIIFTGSAADRQKLKDTLSVVDVATKQVTLEAKIISLSNEDSKQLGLYWEWDALPEPAESDSDEKYGGIIHLGHGYRSNFQATLNALVVSGKAKILATPRVITIPGKEASIFIGDHIPVLTEKSDDGQITTSTEYVDAGIKLSYTPIISEDDFITAVVHTEVSTPTLIAELRNYKITSRTADTNVRMRNGETLIIGGLINEEEQETLRKVPFLSNLPVLGELFKDRSKTKNKTEVIMIMTPHVTAAGESPAIYNTAVINSFAPQKELTMTEASAVNTADEPALKLTMREKAEAILGRELPN